MIPFSLRLISARVGLLLGVYALTRAFFLYWNWNLYSDLPLSEILTAFVLGSRFDLAAILLTNALLVPLWLMPSQVITKAWWRRLEIFAFATINFFALGLNVVDAEFVKFIGKRTSYDFLFIAQDVERHSLSILGTYWHFCLGLLLLMAAVIWLANRPRQPQPESLLSWSFWGWRALALVLIIIGMRGGLQLKPLHPMHAYFNANGQLGMLTLNTPFNIIKSRPKFALERQSYFANDSEPAKTLEEMHSLSRPPLALAPKWNVVILILESFSAEYLGAGNDYPGYTPFLDELAQRSWFFKNNFANSRRSIEGLPAVICGIPAMMYEPIITSDFANNRLDCLPKLLGREGYQTYFLHGAHNGSMHFDTFARIAGFKHFVGLDEYPKDNPEDLDPHWGVLDEPMLQYAIKTMDQSPKPAMVSVFTLSSHHPYYIPPKYKGKFPKGTLEIHESIGYTDYALRQFFKVAETKPWYKNTIFVITADHTQKSDQKKYQDLIGYWRVPLFIYVPGLNESAVKVDKDRITQHIDIMPTLFDLLGYQWREGLLVGQSVLDLGREGHAYNFTGHSYWWIDPRWHFTMERNGSISYVGEHKNTWGIVRREGDAATANLPIDKLKSVVHYMNQGLVKNSLYTWGHQSLDHGQKNNQ